MMHGNCQKRSWKYVRLVSLVAYYFLFLTRESFSQRGTRRRTFRQLLARGNLQNEKTDFDGSWPIRLGSAKIRPTRQSETRTFETRPNGFCWSKGVVAAVPGDDRHSMEWFHGPAARRVVEYWACRGTDIPKTQCVWAWGTGTLKTQYNFHRPGTGEPQCNSACRAPTAMFYNRVGSIADRHIHLVSCNGK